MFWTFSRFNADDEEPLKVNRSIAIIILSYSDTIMESCHCLYTSSSIIVTTQYR